MQRTFGKFLPRTADESQVSVLLKDFEDADKMLSKVGKLRRVKNLRTLTSELLQADRCYESMARLLERYLLDTTSPCR